MGLSFAKSAKIALMFCETSFIKVSNDETYGGVGNKHEAVSFNTFIHYLN